MDSLTKFTIKLHSLTKTTLRGNDKCYVLLKFGLQTLKSKQFHVDDAGINQEFSFAFTSSDLLVFLYRKTILSADNLLGEGNCQVNLDTVETFACPLCDHSTSSFLGDLEFSIKVHSIPSIIDSIFPDSLALSPFKITENVKAFTFAITPIVETCVFIKEIYTWKSKAKSLLTVTCLYLFWLYSAYAPAIFLAMTWL